MEGCEQRADRDRPEFIRTALAVVWGIDCGAEAGRPVRRLLLLFRQEVMMA